MYYEEYGDKDAPLMVYLHGGVVSSWMWEKQVQHFTNYHCVVIDLPEQGRSSDEKTFSIESSAASIIELIEKLGNGKSIILIGFSLGAQVALQILCMKYDLIDYTIVNSALVRPMPFTKKFIRPTITLTYPFIKIRAFSKLQAKTLYINQEYFETYYQESSQMRSEEHTSELQSRGHLVCRLLLEKKK